MLLIRVIKSDMKMDLKDILIEFIAVICLCDFTLARIGFIKDQSLDLVEFPPRTLQTFHSGVPTGHMRPLGWQRKPDGKVKEVEEALSPEEFYTEYVSSKKPVVFRGIVKEDPVLKQWEKDDYLKKKYGKLDIHVVVKKEQLMKRPPKKMTFKTFLKEYMYEDWYLSEVVPAEMMAELSIPKPLKCGMSSHLMESEIWMSSGGTQSLLHSHADHNLHCVFSGRKDFVLIDSQYKDIFDYTEGDAHPGCGASHLDMDRINMYRYKKVAQVPWIWSTLYAGDCILVPATMLHQVRSYGRSFSSTFLWAPAPKYDFSACNETDLDKPMSMDQAPFMWTYTDGAKTLSVARLNSKTLLHHLVVNMRNETTLRFELFEDFYNEVFENSANKENQTPANTVWKIFSNGKKEIPRRTVLQLKDDVLDKVAAEFNKAFEVPAKHDEL